MLTAQGWSILVIWECEVDDHERLLTQIQGFLK
jgi:G:T-mismatch repair DNA endonuclease (very short patch repair protein)